MESRKIQKVGAATLTLSLPKEWAARRNLKKGDPVFLLEEGDTLRVLPGPVAEERQRAQKEFIVDADLCDVPGMLERVIVGNYVLGRDGSSCGRPNASGADIRTRSAARSAGSWGWGSSKRPCRKSPSTAPSTLRTTRSSPSSSDCTTSARRCSPSPSKRWRRGTPPSRRTR